MALPKGFVRQNTEVVVEYFVDLDGSIDSAIAELQSLKKRHQDEFFHLRLESAGEDYNTSARLYGTRPETEKETMNRVNRERGAEIQNREARRKQFERLQKEFT